MRTVEALLSEALSWPDHERPAKDKMVGLILLNESDIKRWAQRGVVVKRAFRSSQSTSSLLVQAIGDHPTKCRTIRIECRVNGSNKPELSLNIYKTDEKLGRTPSSMAELIVLVDSLVDEVALL